VEIAITFVPLAMLWVLAWAALHFGYWWLSLLLAIPAAGVDTLTVREYLSRSFWGRLCYRAYRHPLVMFGVGAASV
jgi:hypothetical protein